MANRIIAVDLGAYSVKVAIAQPGLRHATLTAFVERPVPPAEPGNEAWEARAGRVLEGIAREQRIDHDSVYVSVPGDLVFTHVLEFAFRSLRRAELEKAVGAELEGVVPVELEDMVYTFEPLPADAPSRAPDPTAAAGELAGDPGPGRVAPPAAGMRVLAYAMPRDRAEAWLELTRRAGAPALGLIPEAGPMARLVDRAPSLAAIRGATPVAVVDVGHARTDVVVVRGGKPVYARAITRAGRAVTEVIARHWKLPFAEAEAAKHSDGFIASSTLPASSEAWARVSEVITAELAPLARELRQSLAACRAKTGALVGHVLLVGGGSRLRGLDHYLAEQLGIPVTTLGTGDVEAVVGPRLAATTPADVAALSLGMIADGGTGRPLFDLRQGPLAARGDMSFLRAKAGRLAAAGIAVAACAAASGYAAHYKLRKAQAVLAQRVAEESAEEFGEVKTADQILAGATATATEAASPLPKMTAWDILLEITQRMPAHDKITLDVGTIEIDDQKVFLRGTAENSDEVDAIESALKGIECFPEVTRGATQKNAAGKREFEFTVKSTCM